MASGFSRYQGDNSYWLFVAHLKAVQFLYFLLDIFLNVFIFSDGLHFPYVVCRPSFFFPFYLEFFFFEVLECLYLSSSLGYILSYIHVSSLLHSHFLSKSHIKYMLDVFLCIFFNNSSIYIIITIIIWPRHAVAFAFKKENFPKELLFLTILQWTLDINDSENWGVLTLVRFITMRFVRRDFPFSSIKLSHMFSASCLEVPYFTYKHPELSGFLPWAQNTYFYFFNSWCTLLYQFLLYSKVVQYKQI